MISDEYINSQQAHGRPLRFVKTYFTHKGGSLDNPPEVRYWSTLTQGVLSLIFALLAFNYRIWLNTWGIFYLPWLIFALALFAGFVYYTGALYMNVRDNLPRMVKTKNTTWLFLFTLFYFEIVVLCGLFWFLYILLTYSGVPLCRSELCSGTLTGLVIWANACGIMLTFVLFRTRKLLGIPLLDAFGI